MANTGIPVSYSVLKMISVAPSRQGSSTVSRDLASFYNLSVVLFPTLIFTLRSWICVSLSFEHIWSSFPS